MGKRGIFGYRISEKDKATYSHLDSDPTVLGMTVFRYVAANDLKEIRRVAENIQLVGKLERPTDQDIEYYREKGLGSFAEYRPATWQDILSRFPFEPSVFHHGMKHMLDDSEFLENGVLCDWVYLINLDAEDVEVYKGRMPGLPPRGRYCESAAVWTPECSPVVLIDIFPLDKIRSANLPRTIEDLTRLT